MAGGCSTVSGVALSADWPVLVLSPSSRLAQAPFHGQGRGPKGRAGIVKTLGLKAHHHVCYVLWPKQVKRAALFQRVRKRTPPLSGRSCEVT